MNHRASTEQLLSEALLHARAGRLEEAISAARGAVADSQNDRDRHSAAATLASFLAECGEFKEASTLASASSRFASSAKDPALAARAAAALADVAFWEGKFREAAELYRGALARGESGKFSPGAPQRSRLALALFEEGDREDAAREALAALGEAEAAGDGFARALAAAACTWVGAPLGSGVLSAALEGAEGFPGPRWLGLFAAGRNAEERGQAEEAAEKYSSALSHFRSIWEALPPGRRPGFLSTALRKRFCAELVGETEMAFAAGEAEPREIRREVLEEDEGGKAASGIEDLVSGIKDPYLSERLGEVQARFRNLTRLQEVVKALNSEQKLDRLLDLIMDRAVEIAGAERGFVMLLEGEELKFVAARNMDQEKVKNPEFKVSRSIAQEAFTTGKALLTSNAREDPRFAESGSVHQLKLTSVLCMPLRIKDRVTGVIYLDNRFRAGQFTHEVLQLLEMFNDQVAIALENARLYEETLKARKEVEALNRKLADMNTDLSARVRRQEAELERARRSGRPSAEIRQFGALVARSAAMDGVFKLLDKIIGTEAPVLIQGESGTGKELVARVIHERGPRKSGHFISENCAALSETLLESELFGHVKGAFTGAVADRKGLFELADGGTLFLDEIGETSPGMQAKLLRALQEGEIRLVGGRSTVKVDVRVISASNRKLLDMVGEGTFREDLYYRLNVLQVVVPPLRERLEDLPVLLEHFFGGEAPAIEPEAMKLLLEHRWPGNVRELKNLVERLKALGVKTVTREDLPAEVREKSGLKAAAPLDGANLDELEERFMKAVLLGALEEAGYNKTKAAERLGIPKTTLYNKMKRYGIPDR